MFKWLFMGEGGRKSERSAWLTCMDGFLFQNYSGTYTGNFKKILIFNSLQQRMRASTAGNERRIFRRQQTDKYGIIIPEKENSVLAVVVKT